MTQPTRLPIGIQSFRKLREDGLHYVDKTAHIERLVESGSCYFLSRPRRFGKSLLLDTIQELFEGSESLFRGLHIHSRWNWDAPHPVVRLDFGGDRFHTTEQLRESVLEQVSVQAQAAGVETAGGSAAAQFRHLIRALHAKTGQRVVVLVDEYDKPILDPLTAVDGSREQARRNRDELRALYGNIKTLDAHIRFSFLTGVSKFSKVSLFSELNNLDDITLDPDYATICGYTEADLDAVFAHELEGLDRARVREWYNGYNWRGDERVYNPFDVLLLLKKREFAAHWFETGSPAFLIKHLKAHGVGPLDLVGKFTPSELLSVFDVDEIGTEALLFQTGYLTIVDEVRQREETRYRLSYPNLEVRMALNRRLLASIGWERARDLGSRDRFMDALEAADFEGMKAQLEALFASIPHDWHRRNEIARYEGYYASIVYAWCAASGALVTAEDTSAAGRVDMSVRAGGQVFLFEFKVVEQAGAGKAMAQLKARGYAAKYMGSGEPVHLVGVEFSSEERALVDFKTETVG